MTVVDITEVLGAIRWAVVGGVATRRYMPEKATQDLDVVVRKQDATQARRGRVSPAWRVVDWRRHVGSAGRD
ncbi:MAG: hypothetical protein FJ315_01585 [SAR202 cluster bacterium]|nr:hypothetical protein [SAR202 cluster bacterium]